MVFGSDPFGAPGGPGGFGPDPFGGPGGPGGFGPDPFGGPGGPGGLVQILLADLESRWFGPDPFGGPGEPLGLSMFGFVDPVLDYGGEEFIEQFYFLMTQLFTTTLSHLKSFLRRVLQVVPTKHYLVMQMLIL